MEQNLLSLPQKRSLHASLLSFEKALRMVDRILSDGDVIGILYHQKIHLAPQYRQLIQTEISQTLLELADFAQKMGLEPTEESLEGIIRAEMSISWESLEESRSKRMRGYGDMRPQVAETIDPAIDRFAIMALELSNLISSKQQDETS